MNLDIALSMILLSWLIMHLSICYLTGARAAELSRIQSEARTYLQGRIVDTLNNHLNVKLYTKQYFEVENVRGAQDDERAKNRATLLFIEKSKVLLSLLALVSITLLFWITIRFWQDDHISLGEMIFVFTERLELSSRH